jgi:hypothetical protein
MNISMKDPIRRYDEARSIPDLYEIVKDVVERELGSHRAGIMLCITDLGIGPAGFVGAMFTLGTNAIIVNRQALDMVKAERPDLYKPYVFHILLHEYLHSVGVIDEAETRTKAYVISENAMGHAHPTTKIASDFESILRSLSISLHMRPPQDESMQILEQFDRSSVSYIH